MKFVSPQEWGARVDYDTWSDTPYLKDNVAIHYGGGPIDNYPGNPKTEAAQLRAWEAYHIDGKGWRGLAYGYAVGASGTLYRIRGKNNYGAHQGDEDGDNISNNKEVIPIIFIIGKGQAPTAEMWLTTRALYQWLKLQPWTDGELDVFGHKEIQPKPTECPGDLIMHGIESGWVQLPPPGWEPPSEPDPLEARVAKLEAALASASAELGKVGKEQKT